VGLDRLVALEGLQPMRQPPCSACPAATAHLQRSCCCGDGGVLHAAAGLYRGTAITCIRDFPSHGVYFSVYEASR
jgi:hypothetical protein